MMVLAEPTALDVVLLHGKSQEHVRLSNCWLNLATDLSAFGPLTHTLAHSFTPRD